MPIITLEKIKTKWKLRISFQSIVEIHEIAY